MKTLQGDVALQMQARYARWTALLVVCAVALWLAFAWLHTGQSARMDEVLAAAAPGIAPTLMDELRQVERLHRRDFMIVMALVALLVAIFAAAFRHVSHMAAAAVARLDRSESEFRATFDQAAVGIAHVDMLTGAWRRVNRRFLEMTGYTEHDLAARTVRDLTHRDDMPRQQILIRRLLKREIDSYSLDKRYVRKDGSELWVNLTVSLLRGIDDDPYSTVGIIQDISARKRAEFALGENEAVLQSFYDSVSYGMGVVEVVDGASRYVHVNAAMSALYGLTPADIAGRSGKDLGVPAEIQALWIRKYDETRHSGRPVHFEYARDFHGQSCILAASAAYLGIATSGHPRYSFVTEDITARRHLEEQLRQAHKMEAVGRLAAGVAHDFNNLLSVVLGFSDLLRRRLAEDDPAQAYVADIRTAGERAAALTRQLLAFSRRQVLAPQRVDLNARLVDIVALLGRLLGATIFIETRLAHELPPIEVDPTQLEQVLLNLAVNARDAMPEGGRIVLSTAVVTFDAERSALHPGCVPGQYVMLAVRDSGSGITESDRSHLFEPFFTTKSVGKGTGLGLATVFGIVKQSGGAIEVDSDPGAGSEFRVYLPVAAADVVESTVSDSAGLPEGALHGDEQVLLVEDDDSVRRAVQVMLEEFGYHVQTAASGEAALELLAAQTSLPQLLLIDVVMPGLSGRELAARVLAHHPAIKVLYMSGYTDDITLREELADAQVMFLQKPFLPVTLGRKLREVLDARSAA